MISVLNEFLLYSHVRTYVQSTKKKTHYSYYIKSSNWFTHANKLKHFRAIATDWVKSINEKGNRWHRTIWYFLYFVRKSLLRWCGYCCNTFWNSKRCVLITEAGTARNCVRDDNVSLPNNYPQLDMWFFVDCYGSNKFVSECCLLRPESLLLMSSFKIVYISHFVTVSLIIVHTEESIVAIAIFVNLISPLRKSFQSATCYPWIKIK